MFLTTAVSFFLVEIGNQTQIVTVALAARFHDILVVVAGTTRGMLLPHVLAVLLGDGMTRVLPIRWPRICAALLYLGLGMWGLATTAGWMR